MQPKNRLGVPRRTLHTVRARFDLFSAGDSDDAALLSQDARTCPQARASARYASTASLTVGRDIAASISFPPAAAASYWRAMPSACSHEVVFAEVRKRPLRAGRVPTSHFVQEQRREAGSSLYLQVVLWRT